LTKHEQNDLKWLNENLVMENTNEDNFPEQNGLQRAHGNDFAQLSRKDACHFGNVCTANDDNPSLSRDSDKAVHAQIESL